MKQKPPSPILGPLALFGQLGFTIAIPIIALTILGNYLDGQFKTEPLLTLLGLLLGLISGIYGAYRLLKRAGVLGPK